MTGAGEVLTVHRTDVDTVCRRCGRTIASGRRVALLAGIGGVHLACVIARSDTEENNAVTKPAQKPELRAAVAGDAGEDEIWPAVDGPAAITPRTASVPVADDDDRDLPWWQR